MTGPQFVDPTTPLDAATLNALVVAQSYRISGSVPGTSGSLTLTMPAQKAVVNPSAAPAVYLSVAATSQAVAASKDTYFDLGSGGTYTQVVVTNGAVEPAITADSLRLWKVVSGASAITDVRDLANQSPLGSGTASLASPPNTPAGTGVSIANTTWHEADTIGHNLAENITCAGGRPVLILCTFRYKGGVAIELHFDLAISATTSAPTTSVTGLAVGAAYGATNGLKPVSANYSGDVTVATIAPAQTAGAHRIELWCCFASAPGFGVFVDGVQFVAVEL